ncbi:MAG: GNAT family N-acetyltransferase [Patescibacteria group bacterium]
MYGSCIQWNRSMETPMIKQENVAARGIRFSVRRDGAEAARAYLYIIQNDLHPEPFGLLEDVFTLEQYRGTGLATQIVEAAVAEARRQGCYELIATRKEGKDWLDDFYGKFGFQKWGAELRVTF